MHLHMLAMFVYLVICSDLPAKSDAEAKKHQKMYEEMVSKARKKGESLLS